jgi:hypothetical protein
MSDSRQNPDIVSFVVTRFIGYLRDSRMNTVTTNKASSKPSLTGDRANRGAVQLMGLRNKNGD